MQALVIDDSKPVRSIVGRMLRELGFEVAEAANGREACQRLEQLGRPELVTVNWNMPVMDGIEFLQTVRADARYRDMPTVMISVESRPTQVEHALRAGANGYVVKPFTKDQLVRKLREVGIAVASPTTTKPAMKLPCETRRIRVLIVDDSVVIRHTLSSVLAEDAGLEVAGTAADGRIALDKLRQVTPDVILLDIEMPNMNGFETLKAVRKTHPDLPVIMFSSLTERGAAATLEALMLGANDYVPKPSNVNDLSAARACIRDELIPKIKQFCKLRPHRVHTRRQVAPHRRTPARRVDIVVIGTSTGGPIALSKILPEFVPHCPVPVVIVQHMPPVFTRHLAERLAQTHHLPVREAIDGQRIKPGEVWLAPGDFHVEVTRNHGALTLALNQAPPENSCRPAADVLFRSAAETCGRGTLAVVLTGMGRDGLRGCQRIAEVGGQIIVQDEASSVVWGMPGQVAAAGLADEIVPLEKVGMVIARRLQHRRTAK